MKKEREQSSKKEEEKTLERVHEGSNFGVLRHGFATETAGGPPEKRGRRRTEGEEEKEKRKKERKERQEVQLFSLSLHLHLSPSPLLSPPPLSLPRAFAGTTTPQLLPLKRKVFKTRPLTTRACTQAKKGIVKTEFPGVLERPQKSGMKVEGERQGRRRVRTREEGKKLSLARLHFFHSHLSDAGSGGPDGIRRPCSRAASTLASSSVVSGTARARTRGHGAGIAENEGGH